MNKVRASVLSNILVGIDFSDAGTTALEQALLLASERDQAQLHVAYVAGPAGEDIELNLPEGDRFMSAQVAVEWLEQYVERARVQAMTEGEPIESERVSVHVRVGDADEELVALADSLGAHLIVVGTHGRSGFKRLMLGSVAESIVRSAPCAVLVVRPPQRTADEGE